MKKLILDIWNIDCCRIYFQANNVAVLEEFILIGQGRNLFSRLMNFLKNTCEVSILDFSCFFFIFRRQIKKIKLLKFIFKYIVSKHLLALNAFFKGRRTQALVDCRLQKTRLFFCHFSLNSLLSKKKFIFDIEKVHWQVNFLPEKADPRCQNMNMGWSWQIVCNTYKTYPDFFH